MPRIFISYRREDAAFETTAVHEKLATEFGPENVFLDVDNIPAGQDFRKIIRKSVQDCDVLIAVVGERWLGAAAASGQRRLDMAADFVRIEIEAALDRDIPVIPLFVSRAAMPDADEMPPSLREFVFRNGLSVRPGKDFRHDIGELIRQIRLTCEYKEQERAAARPPSVAPEPPPQPPAAPPPPVPPRTETPGPIEPVRAAVPPVTPQPERTVPSDDTAPDAPRPAAGLLVALFGQLRTAVLRLLARFNLWLGRLSRGVSQPSRARAAVPPSEAITLGDEAASAAAHPRRRLAYRVGLAFVNGLVAGAVGNGVGLVYAVMNSYLSSESVLTELPLRTALFASLSAIASVLVVIREALLDKRISAAVFGGRRGLPSRLLGSLASAAADALTVTALFGVAFQRGPLSDDSRRFPVFFLIFFTSFLAARALAASVNPRRPRSFASFMAGEALWFVAGCLFGTLGCVVGLATTGPIPSGYSSVVESIRLIGVFGGGIYAAIVAGNRTIALLTSPDAPSRPG